MKKVTVSNEVNSANSNITVNNGASTMVNKNNEQEETIMTNIKIDNNSNNENTFNKIVEQPKTYLATTKTGRKIYMCDETLEHMKAHSDVSIEHIKEAIEQNNTYQGPFEIKTISLGYIIGQDHCIEVTENDPDVHQLYRKNRAGTTPATFSKEAPYTSLITIGICIDEDLKDTLFTAFYGQLAPREPWDPSLPEQERPESEEFWKTHAIVVTPEEIDWDRVTAKYECQYPELGLPREVVKMNEKNNGNIGTNSTMVNDKIKKEVINMEKAREQYDRESFDALIEQTAQEERKRQHEREMNRFYKQAIDADERRYLDISKSAEEKEEEARRDADQRLFEATHFLDMDAERCRMESIVRNGYEESKDAFWDDHMNDIQKRACNLMALCTIDKDIAANNTFYRKGIRNVPNGFHDVEVAITAFRAPGLVDAAFWAPRLRANIDKIVAYQKQTQDVIIIQFPEIWAAFKAVVENYGIDNVPPVYKMLYTWYYDHATKEEKRDFEEYLPKAMNRFSWVYTTGRSSSKYPIYNVWRNIALGRNINDAPDGVSPEFADKIRAYTDKAYALLFTEAREYSDDELDDLEAKAMRYYREKFWEAKYLPKVEMDYNMLVKRASENEMAWKILDAFDDMTDAGAAEYAARVIKARQAEAAKIKAQEPLRKYAEALINAMCEGLNDDQDYSKQ